MKFSRYLPEFAVFVCGAVVMIYEIVGSRILGPYFGTSSFVWTGLIGVILGSLSLGYYFGGKIADKKADIKILSLIIFLSSLLILITLFVKDSMLELMQKNINDIRLSTVISSILLFSPTSFLLGMVSPYTVKLKLESLESSGSTIGNLYALSTLGSIVGTFLAGFVLIPLIGTNKLLFILSITLFGLSFLLITYDMHRHRYARKILILLFSFIILSVAMYISVFGEKKKYIDIDTQYNRIWIYDYTDIKTSKKARMMGINNENHSSMYLNSDELVNEYTKYYHLVRYFNPNFKRALMLGGAGYSYPKDFLAKYPGAYLDVVEIDPKITELAKQYFKLEDNPYMRIYHQDGRVFLNRTKNKYDVIFGDAFSSRHSVPFHLTTKESVLKEYNILNEEGVVILNVISSIEGNGGEFLRAEYATYKSVFPQVHIFPIGHADSSRLFQNIIIVAVKSSRTFSFISNDEELNRFLSNRWTEDIRADVPILTDDYAPVEYYINKANW